MKDVVAHNFPLWGHVISWSLPLRPTGAHKMLSPSPGPFALSLCMVFLSEKTWPSWSHSVTGRFLPPRKVLSLYCPCSLESEVEGAFRGAMVMCVVVGGVQDHTYREDPGKEVSDKNEIPLKSRRRSIRKHEAMYNQRYVEGTVLQNNNRGSATAIEPVVDLFGRYRYDSRRHALWQTLRISCEKECRFR